MNKQPEKWWACVCACLLTACSPSEEKQPENASAVRAASSAAIANTILQNEAQDDILQARKQAKAEVSESDIAALETPMFDTASSAFTASVPTDLPPLHPICEQYYQRADACFAKQGTDAAALRAQNQEAKIAVMREQPDETTCQLLSHSFDNVALNLGCE